MNCPGRTGTRMKVGMTLGSMPLKQCGSCASELLLFTRYPTEGAVKMRLATEIGAARAAAAHDVMTHHCLAVADAAAAMTGALLRVMITGATLGNAAAWLGGQRSLIDQGDGGLGDRVHRALDAALQQGARRVVVIGADCPALTPALIADGFTLLEKHDVTLGPAIDGGFYLLGIAAGAAGYLPGLMDDLPWGTGQVRARLEENARHCGATVAHLAPLNDIDTLADIDPCRWPWLAEAAGLLHGAAVI